MQSTFAPVVMSYDLRLVALSFVIAVFASYTTLDLAGQTLMRNGRMRFLFLIAGSVALGIGMWSMHFTAMLASAMNNQFTYDLLLVIVSMVVVILVSAFVLLVICRAKLHANHLIGAGSMMGLGIMLMHYLGTAAVCNSAFLGYNIFLFAASVGIAIVASIGGLWVAFQLRNTHTASWSTVELKLGSSLVLGSAITGMHYTNMAAMIFTPLQNSVASFSLAYVPQLFTCGVDPIVAATPATGGTLSLGFGVGLATLFLLCLSMFASLAHEYTCRQTASVLSHTDALYKTGFMRTTDLSFETTVMARDGREVETGITNASLKTGDMVGGMYSIVKDVSEQKQTAVGLRQGEDRFHSRVEGKEGFAATAHTFSTTAVPVYDGILLMPTVGLVDALFGEWHVQALREAIERYQTTVILIDVSHLYTINQTVAAGMARVICHAAARGAHSIIIDSSGEIRSMLMGYGTPENSLIVHNNLRKGIDDAMTIVEQHRRNQSAFPWPIFAPATVS